MPFCPQCGKEIEQDAAFCPSCGAGINARNRAADKKSDLDARTYLMISAAAVGALALIALILRDALGVVIAAASCAALYFFGVKKLDEKDINTAQVTALIVGIVVAAIGFVILFSGTKLSFLGILDIAAVVPALMAWNMLRK